MAYILGFFCADGSMIKNKRGAHFIGFQITDKDLLFKIWKALNSNHKISIKKRRNTNQKTIYQLQIGSKEIYKDLLELGLKNRKSKRLNLPQIPEKYFPNFIRGFLMAMEMWLFVHTKERQEIIKLLQFYSQVLRREVKDF